MPDLIAFSQPNSQGGIASISAGATGITYLAGTTTSYTITLPSSGTIQAFQALFNATGISGNKVHFKIYRNGVLVSSSSVALDEYVTSFGTAGILLNESLGFLAGSSVAEGETFKLQITKDGAFGLDIIGDAIIRMTWAPQGISYVA